MDCNNFVTNFDQFLLFGFAYSYLNKVITFSRNKISCNTSTSGKLPNNKIIGRTNKNFYLRFEFRYKSTHLSCFWYNYNFINIHIKNCWNSSLCYRFSSTVWSWTVQFQIIKLLSKIYSFFEWFSKSMHLPPYISNILMKNSTPYLLPEILNISLIAYFVIALTVNVLPDPVYPYAKHVTIPFWKMTGNRSLIEN